ncbi:tRNA (cytidine(34)-2'-O)-methyltransferase [Stieleria sp. TO1_6]|uniref:tRNA (cytidine(34)-2'-O)-methyltransferase n=1 Tax=Stieleria tagensis TaxID=2956795 RepID=UPI00209A7800|nr:tRNA (cytidine(34)-2'-O)-methyltransferase [Stieleria tagensis]MCO8122905.1 tRNA (cytidine(34)-2'-O)-methyltransferase [Stieleria tagensis]
MSAQSPPPPDQPEQSDQPAPEHQPTPVNLAGRSADSTPIAHVVLYQPEIPQNTGNIGRSCVAVGAKLWIVRPASFDFSDKRVRRAGLDYWKHLDLEAVDQWDDIAQRMPPERTFFFSRFATRTLWDVEFQAGDCFVFGRETAGLPREIVGPGDPHALRLPTSEQVRSLNLATTVGIVLFEQQRQLQQCDRADRRPSRHASE